MRYLLFLFFACKIFCCDAQIFTSFIGTYTGSGSKGIYVYHFNASTGKAEWISNTDSVSNPSYLVISKNGKYVYAVNETNKDNPGRVSAYSFDKVSSKLKFINSEVTGGDDPCYVSVSKNNKWIAVSNYSGGSVAVFPVNNDGSLKPYSQFIQDTGSGVNKQRQEKAHVHAAVFSPDEKFLFTPDLGLDKVMIYKFNQSAQQPLEPAAPSSISIDGGNGPRHFTFHPNKKFAYLIEELAGKVAVYQYNNGQLKFVQQVITHPKDFKGDIGSADIHISPDGKFLYASNRGDENTITIFSINESSGRLTLKGYQSTLGKTPRNFSIDPTGKYLLVANQDSDNIVIFKRNMQTGLLQYTGKQIKLPKPVCVQFSY